MIITIRSEASDEERSRLMALLSCLIGSQYPLAITKMGEREVIALDGHHLDAQAQEAIRQQTAVEQLHYMQTSYKLVSRAFQAKDTCIVIGDTHQRDTIVLGERTTPPVIIAGPCAIESREQLLATARAVKQAGAHMLRGGAFKPRTSPYQFRGLGVEGLCLLAEARDVTGLAVITEAMEPDMVETVADYADIVQIGSRNMQNFALLQAAGRHRQQRPIMLKRGFSATIEEWLLAAEYIVAAGNPHVILCERGIRSFDPQTRNVLDLSCVPLLHELTHLPIVVDPSHGTGRRELVAAMSRASIAAGADGLMLEVHLDPDNALSDGRQSITPEQLQMITHETLMLAHILRDEIKDSLQSV